MSRAPSFESADLVESLRLKDLLFLQTIADCKSLTGAAAVFAIAQPAASRWLRDLEHLFRSHLFTRDRMVGMTPTPLGQLVLIRARALLADVSALSSEIAAHRSGRGGFLQLGVIPYVSSRLLEKLVATLIGDYAMTVSIVEAATAPLMDRLRMHQVQAVIGRCSTQPVTAELRQEVLFTQKACLVVHRESEVVRSSPVRLAGLTHCRWVLPPRDSPTWQAIVSGVGRSRLSIPQASVETASTKLVHSLVSASRDMVAVLPSEIGSDLEKLGGVRAIPFPAAFKMPPVGLFAHARNWEASQMLALRKTLRALIATGNVL